MKKRVKNYADVHTPQWMVHYGTPVAEDPYLRTPEGAMTDTPWRPHHHHHDPKSNLAPFWRLQSVRSSCALSSVDLPPRATGLMWSTSAWSNLMMGFPHS